EQSGSFTAQVPQEADELVLDVTGTDRYGNTAQRAWRYAVMQDAPPVIDIRSPAPGLRVREGEQLSVNFTVSDDKRVEQARVLVEQQGNIRFEKVFTASQIAAATSAGNFLNALLPVPTAPAQGESFRFVVQATDSAGQTSEKPVDVMIVDDEEAPVVQMTQPAS